MNIKSLINRFSDSVDALLLRSSKLIFIATIAGLVVRSFRWISDRSVNIFEPYHIDLVAFMITIAACALPIMFVSHDKRLSNDVCMLVGFSIITTSCLTHFGPLASFVIGFGVPFIFYVYYMEK